MIKDLKCIKKNEVHLFGGKAANLGFLMQNGFNVPEGFCISTKIDRIDNKIKREIVKKFKKFKSKVAVRSSATLEDSKKSSFAGQFDTFLNVDDKEQLIAAITKCKISIESKRAKYYISGKKLSNVEMAVIVQTMINADYAGVIFTVDPIKKKHILIEIVKGLGDKLVSGEVTPSSYFIDKTNMKIKNEFNSFNINKNIIQKLVKTALKIESIYKTPQDIEFCVKNGKIFILQSRPITAL